MRLARGFGLVVVVLAFAAPLGAQDFPPITDLERALTRVDGAPNAPAVVLSRHADFYMMDLARNEISSRLVVRERVKILTEEGKSHGEREIHHNSYVRLYNLRARTVLPDGRVVPLPSGDRFERRLSRNERYYVTAYAMPAVEVGAILDSEYELRFDSFYFLEPWLLSDVIPVRLAEIVYHVPKEIGVQTWSRDPFQVGVKTEKTTEVRWNLLKARAENLPAIPDEPFRLPDGDLATQILIVPTAYSDADIHQRLLESWASTSELLAPEWEKALRRGRDAAKKGKELAAAAGKSKRDQAAAIYRFVRDQITTDEIGGIFLQGKDPSVDTILSAGHGSHAEKAALLEAMLDAVGLTARPVWAAGRSGGLIDPQVANPAWFDRAIVAVDLGKEGGRVYLEPADRRLAFGRLDVDLEGTAALLPDAKKPEGVVLSELPLDQNGERAKVELEVDAEGVARGTGTLQLAGARAVAKLRWRDSPDKTAEAWKTWLGERFTGFSITEVNAKEDVEASTVDVTWKLAQREDEALGDEVTLAFARPFGPMAQPFAVPAASRRSPILFSAPYFEEVDLVVRWPEGWKTIAQPKATRTEGPAGLYLAEVTVDAAARIATFHRRFELRKKLFASREDCDAVRTLFGDASKGDTLALVLAKP